MLLEIIDGHSIGSDNESGENNVIKMVLSGDAVSEEYVCDYEESPFTAQFRKNLQYFLFGRIVSDNTKLKVQAPMEKFFRLGHALGDSLLGEDHELLRLLSIIEREGYEKLEVSIVSTRPEFFSEFWEAAVLHDAKYLFATQVKRFSRVFDRRHQESLPTVEYQLNVTPPHQDEINQLLNNGSETTGSKENNPLRVIYATPFAKYDTVRAPLRNNVQACLTLNELNSALDVNLCYLRDVSDLKHTLSTQFAQGEGEQYHILHLQGVVSFEEGRASLMYGSSNSEQHIDLKELFECAAGDGIRVLFLDIAECRSNDCIEENSRGLAEVAQIAQHVGITNIVGLSHQTLPWLSEACFSEIYRQILAGHDISTAVVEARKLLQMQNKNRYSLDDFNHFPAWLLLQHYGAQHIQFFAAPQLSQEGTEINPLNAAHATMFGFRGEKLPPLAFSVSDQSLSDIIAYVQSDVTRNTDNSAKNKSRLIDATEPQRREIESTEIADRRSGKIISVTGQQGVGKTHHAYFACFYLSLKQQYYYSFNFSFADEGYTAEDIADMIAPVLQTKAADVLERLKTVPCAFIFDDLDVLLQSHDTQRIQAFRNLFVELKQQEHCVFLVGNLNQHESALRDYFVEDDKPLIDLSVELAGLPNLPGRIVGSLALEKASLSLVTQNSDATPDNENVVAQEAWEKLVRYSQGNPSVIQRLTPLLSRYAIEDILSHVSKASLTSDTPLDVIDQWQWQELPDVWQNFLTLCGEMPGLLLEMVMIAADQEQEADSPSRKLFALLGDESAKVKEGLQRLSAAGFTKLLPHGHMVENKALHFVKDKQYKSEFDSKITDELNFLFSQVISQGVLRLSQFVLKNPNPPMSNNLISNRKHWVKHFERLWFHDDYARFMAVRKSFQQLLTQAKLQHELVEWSGDLLTRTEISPQKIENTGFAVAWLGLAVETLSFSSTAKENSGLEKGAGVWRDWFVDQSDTIEEKDLARFQMVVNFLNHYAKLNADTETSSNLCLKAYEVYFKFQAWHGVIAMLKILAVNAFDLNNTDDVENYERKILEEIAYDDAPAGFQIQQMVDVLLMRMARQNFELAESLFHEIKSRKDSTPMAELLDGVEADLRCQKGEYFEALPYFCKLWERSLSAQSPAQIEQLKARFKVFETNLGRERLELLLAEYLDESSPSPLTQEFSIH
ncbi:hypothetical protein [Teredinibacter haidensis]|uniref:hypothetical protein n=1 Tax=Teredinibacter haidensis TaxID=2731755 RepID=UPI000948E7D1|nr:hypothetical protein [Teredinibacter haidensis]